MNKICLLTLMVILPLLNGSLYARDEGYRGGDYRRGEGDREAYNRGFENGASYGDAAGAFYGGYNYVPYTNGPEDWSAPQEESIFQQNQE